MRIGFNSEKILQRTTGVGCYAYNLIKHLLAQDKENRYFLFFHSDTNNCSEANWMEGDNVEIDSVFSEDSNVRRIIWEQLTLPKLANEKGLDIFHYVDHSLSIISKPVPTVITVHDLAFFRHPEAYTMSRRVYKSLISRPSIRRANKIITVSEYTKQEVLELTGVDPGKVHVVHNGINDEFRLIQDREPVDRFIREHSLPPRYILFVGTLQPRKNVVGLIKSYALLMERKAVPHHLVICGEKGWIFDEIFMEVERSRLNDRVRFIESIPHEHLPYLYNGAELFVYPSLFEGFGLPLLEAMRCGVPVVASSTTSMPEVVGDAGVLIDPNDVEGFAQSMEEILCDGELAADLARRGLERSREFSWDKCARQTLDIYRSMV